MEEKQSLHSEPSSEDSSSRSVTVTLPSWRTLRTRLSNERTLSLLALATAFLALAYTWTAQRQLSGRIEVWRMLQDFERSADSLRAVNDSLLFEYRVWQAMQSYRPSIDLRETSLQDAGSVSWSVVCQ